MLEALQIESAEADAIVAELGGSVVRGRAGGAWTSAKSLGELRVTHAAPLCPAADIVAAIAGDREVTDRRSLRTAEGELAALATIDGDGMQIHVGLIFAGSQLTSMITRCTAPALFAVFARLAELAVTNCRLERGLRRRAYLYRPPPGWFAVRSFQRTAWYAPSHPNRHGIIEVVDATGRLDQDRGQASLAAQSSIELDIGSRHTSPIRTAAGLRGELHQYFDRRRAHVVETVCVLGDQFAYLLRMEANRSVLEECRRAFELVVDSIAPLGASR